MAFTTARYWQIGFYTYDSTSTSSSANRWSWINRLDFYQDDNTRITDAIKPVVTVASDAGGVWIDEPATYPTDNLFDDDDLTYMVLEADDVYHWRDTWVRLGFDFGVDVTPAYIGFVASNSGVGIRADEYRRVWVRSSQDGITYTDHTLQYLNPLPVADTLRLMAIQPDSYLATMIDPKVFAGDGGIYGIVSEDGVAYPNRPVYLYDRETMTRIGYALTDENGGYGFNHLNRSRDYLLLSVDPSGPPYKNAIAKDRITPINTLSNPTVARKFIGVRYRNRNMIGMMIPKALRNPVNEAGFVQLNQGSCAARWVYSSNNDFDGYEMDASAPSTRGGGLVQFIKGNNGVAGARFSDGTPMMFTIPRGSLTGSTGQNEVDNTSAFTFEMAVITPLISDPSQMHIMLLGTQESDDGNDLWSSSSYYYYGKTWIISVAATSVTVRMALGSWSSITTARITHTLVEGTEYHIVVTWERDGIIRLWVDGVEVGTFDAAGTGSPYRIQHNYNNPGTDWNGSNAGNLLRRVTKFFVVGDGAASRYEMPGRGWNGSIGLLALYGKYFTQADVDQLYNTYVDPATGTLVPTLTGYAGEVEADSPLYYFRLGSPQVEVEGIPHATIWNYGGTRNYYGSPDVGQFGKAGFVSGGFSMNINSTANSFPMIGGEYHTWPEAFTVECFFRIPTVTGTHCIYCSRYYNSNICFYLSVESNRTMRMILGDINGSDLSYYAATNILDATDYHVAVTYDAFADVPTLRLYLNGAEVYSVGASHQPRSATGEVYWDAFGVNVSATGPSRSNWLEGDIAEVALYPYPLDATRILAHYDARVV